MEDQQRSAAGSSLRAYGTPKLQHLGALSKLTASGSGRRSEANPNSNLCIQEKSLRACK